MAASLRTSSVGGATSGTSDRTVAITPAVGDLLLVYCFVSTNTNDAPTCSDNNGAGTYTRVDVANVVISTVNHRLSVFVRDALMANTTATTITVATGSNTSGALVCCAVAGMTRTGADAVRSKGIQNNQAAGTPAPVLNQAALTGNMTVVACASADTTTTPPTNWAEAQDTSQSTPTVALEVATRASGFTGTTITFGAAASTTFASHALELDGSAVLTRSTLLAAAGAVTAAAFQRERLRSAAVSAAGAVTSAGTFFSVFERSSAVAAVGAVTAAGEAEGGSATLERSSAFGATVAVAAAPQRDLLRSSSVAAAGSVAASGEFFTTFERSTLLSASGAVTASALRELLRSTLLSASGALSASPQRDLLRGALVAATGAVSASGSGEAPGATEYERAASFGAASALASSGFSIRERAASLAASGLVAAAGRRDLLRAASLAGAASIAASGSASAAGATEYERSASLAAAGAVTVSRTAHIEAPAARRPWPWRRSRGRRYRVPRPGSGKVNL
jgi:hypothetical protein